VLSLARLLCLLALSDYPLCRFDSTDFPRVSNMDTNSCIRSARGETPGASFQSPRYSARQLQCAWLKVMTT
jgi:hypothetical protein